MGFNFTQVEKGKVGFSSTMPDDTIRIGKKTLSANETIAKLFHSTRYKTDGYTRVKLNYAYDMYNQAIQVTASPQGFAATINDNDSLTATMPSSMRKAGLPIGDYKLVPGETNIFQLAR